MNRLAKSIFLSVFLLAGLAGCSSDDEVPQDMTEKELYESAQDSLRQESYQNAVKKLQLLEARFPFGPYAEQAQLEIIYAHYLNFESEASIAAADRFIRLHPQHPNADYAYYIKGLANYVEGEGFLDRFLPTDMTMRDPGAALQSFEDFRQLLYRYPDSPYASDAKARMLYLRARLARYDINVANYYFERGAYIAAANRGRYVVENFPQTPATADALAVMVQAYQLLSLDDLAADALAMLNENYSDHPSIDENGAFISKFSVTESEPSFINKASFGLFDRSAPPEFNNRADYLDR
jgi:outer membrane protein assembly factor BamD